MYRKQPGSGSTSVKKIYRMAARNDEFSKAIIFCRHKKVQIFFTSRWCKMISFWYLVGLQSGGTQLPQPPATSARQAAYSSLLFSLFDWKLNLKPLYTLDSFVRS